MLEHLRNVLIEVKDTGQIKFPNNNNSGCDKMLSKEEEVLFESS